MKARIISGAAKAFIAKNLRHSSGFTKEQRNYIDKMESLENVVLNVRNSYDKRIVLEYPICETTKDGKGVVGIDVDAEYVEIVEQ
jgi:hypothetical protein